MSISPELVANMRSLVQAVKNDGATLEEVLSASADPWDSERLGLLLAACCEGRQYHLVAPLLARGADPVIGSDDPVIGSDDHVVWPALHLASDDGQVDAMAALLDAGAPRERGAAASRGATPLLTAARKGRVAAVKLLLGRGADVFAVCNHGLGALARAHGAKEGDVQGTVSVLEEAAGGPDGVRRMLMLDGSLDQGFFESLRASTSLSLVQRYLQEGVDVKAIPFVVEVAFANCASDVCKAIIDAGASVEAATRNLMAEGASSLLTIRRENHGDIAGIASWIDASKLSLVDAVEAARAGCVDLTKSIVDGGIRMDHSGKPGHVQGLPVAARLINRRLQGGPDRFVDENVFFDTLLVRLFPLEIGCVSPMRSSNDGWLGRFGRTNGVHEQMALAKDFLAQGKEEEEEEEELEVRHRGDKFSLEWMMAHAFVLSGDWPVLVPFLLSVGARPDAYDRDGFTPLLRCAVQRDDVGVPVAQQLLEAGADVHAPELCNFGFQPLHYACHSGRVGLCRLLLEAGASPGDLDATGTSAWVIAVFYEQPEVVDLMLAHGASPTDRDGNGNSLLAVALRKQPQLSALEPPGRLAAVTDIVTKLLNAGCVDDDDGLQVLEAALVAPRPLRELLWQRVQPSLEEKQRQSIDGPDAGMPVLLCAVRSGDLELVDSVLEAGCSLTASAEPIGTWPGVRIPLLAAAALENLVMFRALIERGASVEHSIHIAEKLGRNDIADLLVTTAERNVKRRATVR